MSKIRFVSRVPGLSELEWARPKPAKHYAPSWFKSMPASVIANNETVYTIKNCPALPDYFSQGYVMPMWMDSELSYNKENHEFSAKSSPSFDKWAFHGDAQFLDHVDASNLGFKSEFIFKASCPWNAITEPGWSVLQLPIFYNFNKNWTILPGVIDTDICHELNQQVLFYGNKEKVVIEAGEAFVLYVPFKREKHKLEVEEANKKDLKKLDLYLLESFSNFTPNGIYRKKQRDRDKPKKGFLENLKDRLEE
jgi:hypothetical protein